MHGMSWWVLRDDKWPSGSELKVHQAVAERHAEVSHAVTELKLHTLPPRERRIEVRAVVLRRRERAGERQCVRGGLGRAAGRVRPRDKRCIAEQDHLAEHHLWHA